MNERDDLDEVGSVSHFESADTGVEALRVFEMGRMGSPLEVDLPRRWARRHATVVVAFRHTDSEMGWHAHVVGDEGIVLLSFPWIDRVDEILRNAEYVELPVELDEEGWYDLEQGWWGRVIVDGPDLYLAETELEAMCDIVDQQSMESPKRGVVLVDGVEVRWSCVSKAAYDAAWKQAIEACHQGAPSPVGRWAEDAHRLVLEE